VDQVELFDHCQGQTVIRLQDTDVGLNFVFNITRIQWRAIGMCGVIITRVIFVDLDNRRR
jgi:hypothetical protein